MVHQQAFNLNGFGGGGINSAISGTMTYGGGGGVVVIQVTASGNQVA